MKNNMRKLLEEINQNITEIQKIIYGFINNNCYGDSQNYLRLLISWNEAFEDVKAY
jgi:hypothetical protein